MKKQTKKVDRRAGGLGACDGDACAGTAVLRGRLAPPLLPVPQPAARSHPRLAAAACAPPVPAPARARLGHACRWRATDPRAAKHHARLVESVRLSSSPPPFPPKKTKQKKKQTKNTRTKNKTNKNAPHQKRGSGREKNDDDEEEGLWVIINHNGKPF